MTLRTRALAYVTRMPVYPFLNEVHREAMIHLLTEALSDTYQHAAQIVEPQPLSANPLRHQLAEALRAQTCPTCAETL